jgi:hypothetical protein
MFHTNDVTLRMSGKLTRSWLSNNPLNQSESIKTHLIQWQCFNTAQLSIVSFPLIRNLLY